MADDAGALIVVDVQNDFCEGGALGVTGGHAVAHRIAEHLAAHRGDYSLVVATRDWHLDPGPHFSENPDYRDSWPVHCVAGTPGAALHPELSGQAFDAIFNKGMDRAAYSGFEGVDESGRTLADALRAAGVEKVDICGIATDYCVRATALDAAALGLQVRILSPMCAAVAPATGAAALDELRAAGCSVEP